MTIHSVSAASIIALVFQAVTLEAHADWRRDKESGCKIWDKIAGESVEGDPSWYGYCDEEGKATGISNLYWKSKQGGSRTLYHYIGEMKGGQFHGKGTLTWKNGDTYEGDWNNGVRDGHGIARWTSGDRYEGAFRNDKMHGKGIYRWRGGDRYEGDWVDGERTGLGSKTNSDGSIASGTWQKGRLIQRFSVPPLADSIPAGATQLPTFADSQPLADELARLAKKAERPKERLNSLLGLADLLRTKLLLPSAASELCATVASEAASVQAHSSLRQLATQCIGLAAEDEFHAAERPLLSLALVTKPKAKYYSQPFRRGTKPAGSLPAASQLLKVVGFDELSWRILMPQGAITREVWLPIALVESYSVTESGRNSRIGMIEAYNVFLRKHPSLGFQERVTARVDALLFEQAQADNRRQSYEQYLSQFPLGQFAAQAKGEVERRRFQELGTHSTLAAMQEYLAAYPGGTYRDEVLKLIEAKDFAAVMKLDSISEVEAFLRRYPNGTQFQGAKRELDRLHFVAAMKSATTEALEEYIASQPGQEYLARAKEAILALQADEDYRRAHSAGSLEAYTSFLRLHPLSPNSNLAKQMVALLEFDNTGLFVRLEDYFRSYHLAARKEPAKGIYNSALDRLSSLGSVQE